MTGNPVCIQINLSDNITELHFPLCFKLFRCGNQKFPVFYSGHKPFFHDPGGSGRSWPLFHSPRLLNTWRLACLRVDYCNTPCRHFDVITMCNLKVEWNLTWWNTESTDRWVEHFTTIPATIMQQPLHLQKIEDCADRDFHFLSLDNVWNNCTLSVCFPRNIMDGFNRDKQKY